jgi:hypothetical protein
VDYYEYDSAYNVLTDGSGPASTRGLAQWERKSYTFTTKSDAAYVKIRVVADGTPIGEAFVDNIQLEQKPYATSFIDGTRSLETLTIPTAGVLNPQEGTWEDYVYVNSVARRQVPGQYPYVFYIPRGNGGPGIVLWHTPDGASWRLGTWNDSGVATAANASDSYTPDGWHRFAVRWNSSEAALFIDGVKRISITNPNLPTSFGSYAYVGSEANGANSLNTLHDDLRISSRARTDEEIAAAYASGQPLPVDADTTYKMSFDGTLTPQKQALSPRLQAVGPNLNVLQLDSQPWAQLQYATSSDGQT